jgi:hypothetical protein
VAPLRSLSKPGSTLFVLPEVDSTAQIHVMADMAPPGMWAWGDYWILRAPDVKNNLLFRWAITPPDYMVYFPDQAAEHRPDIDPLVDFMNSHYEPVTRVDSIVFHGPAIIFKRVTEP